MRFIHTPLLLAALVLTSTAAPAQTVDELVDKSLAASGGRAALGKITSRSMTGKMSVSTENGDISGTIEGLNEAPNKMRRLITLDLSQFGMGSATIEQRFDGTTGYQLDSMRGDSPLSASQIENLKNSIFPSPFLDYKERGTKILLGGKDKVGDRDVYALSITPTSGPVTRLFIDASTYLPVRAIVTLEAPEVGSLEQTTDFSDYRDVDGVRVPFVIKGSSAIQTFTITVTKVEHNVKVDPALFTKPVAK
jgi:outer membrane lipoprotein-sorting protein